MKIWQLILIHVKLHKFLCCTLLFCKPSYDPTFTNYCLVYVTDSYLTQCKYLKITSNLPHIFITALSYNLIIRWWRLSARQIVAGGFPPCQSSLARTAHIPHAAAYVPGGYKKYDLDIKAKLHSLIKLTYTCTTLIQFSSDAAGLI